LPNNFTQKNRIFALSFRGWHGLDSRSSGSVSMPSAVNAAR